ncbi:MAG TPA: glycosyltransferase [Chloroflexota bacterium]|nr:glycosyltransferase [Chloroflexota bacterium]
MKTIVFFPEGAFGPTNNCVGIGNVLRKRGHRVVFVVEESFAGTLEAQGFEEARMRLKPAPEVEEEPGQFWKDFIRHTAPHFREDPFDQIETLTYPIWQELVDGARYVEPRLREIFAEIRPDVVVQDNVVGFPAVVSGDFPWVRIVSCNPLEIADPALPPALSGLAINDRTNWKRFRQRYADVHTSLHTEFDAFCRENGAPALPGGEFMWESPYLNIYNYPRELDYPRSHPRASTWHRLDACVRAGEAEYEVPGSLGGSGRLIYLSLGSLGSADTGLMQRLIDILGNTRHRYIVSMGPQHEELTLAPNMSGAEFLPQTTILPLVDLVITHGGNNTVTESLHFGKPMVVLPLFWDQHDNAQRVEETGFGVRLQPYRFEEDGLIGAVERILADDALRARLDVIARRSQAAPGTERAARLIEGVAAKGLDNA